jgi:hypothetical protein
VIFLNSPGLVMGGSYVISVCVIPWLGCRSRALEQLKANKDEHDGMGQSKEKD